MPINSITDADLSKYKPEKKDKNMHMYLYLNVREIRQDPSLKP